MHVYQRDKIYKQRQLSHQTKLNEINDLNVTNDRKKQLIKEEQENFRFMSICYVFKLDPGDLSDLQAHNNRKYQEYERKFDEYQKTQSEQQ